MYYIEDLKLKRYFCRFQGQDFKTQEEYYQFLVDNNIPTEDRSYMRKSAYAINADPVPLYKMQTYKVALGTHIYDSRDYSMYQFNSEEEIQEFLDYLKIQPDRFLQQCFYDGYEGDYVDSIEYLANQWAETYKDAEHIFDIANVNTTFAHFIISYYPDEEAVRAKRKAALVKVIENMKEITPNTFIYINAQNYKEEDYLDDPAVIYLFKHEEGVGPMRARNEMLEWFYESNYEYMILSDDDAFLAPTGSAKDFFKELRNNVEKFTKIPMDVCYSRNMQYKPANRKDIDRCEIRGKKWELNFCANCWLCWVVIRNFKKAYGDVQLMDEEVKPWENKGYDDTDFSFQLASKYKSWQNDLLQLMPFNAGEKNSAIYNKVTNPMYRIYNMDITRTKWMGPKMPDGHYNYDEFRRKRHQAKRVMFDRETPVDNVHEEFKGRRSSWNKVRG